MTQLSPVEPGDAVPSPLSLPPTVSDPGLGTEAERFQFLSAASQLLSSALSPDEMFRRLGEVLVPRLADWYALDGALPGGGTERLALAHVDPEKVKWAHEIAEKYPPDPHEVTGVPQVLRTGRSELYPHIPDELLVHGARDAEHLALIRSIGFTGAIIVPLVAGGETVGALTLVSAESGRIYTESDLAVAEFIGRQAGTALLNARLYAEVRLDRERLRRKRQRLDDLIRAVPGIVWEAWGEPDSEEQRIDFVSDHVLPMLGYTPAEWLATPNFWLTLVHPEDREIAVTNARARYDGRGASTNEFRWIAKDGRVVWVQAESSAVLERGVPIGMRGITFDITPRKEAEQRQAALEAERERLLEAVKRSEEQFRTLAESMPQLVFVANTRGGCDYFNERWLGYTGMAAAETYDQDLGRFIHPDDRPGNVSKWTQAVASASVHENELRLRGEDGSYRWFLVRAVPRRDAGGVPTQWFGTCTDIEEHKRNESQIRELAATLETRVASRTQALEEANRELESFSYSVSHDLRAPIRHIAGYADKLRREISPATGSDAERFTRVIIDSARQMGVLIDALLAFSRMGRTELVPARVAAPALVAEIVANQRALFTHEVEVVLGPLPDLHGDPMMLRSVLTNLIENAFKYTSKTPGARVEIAGEVEGGVVTYSVKDNGAGFDPRYVAKLFGVFQRLHRPEDFQGTGIGLASVRRIVGKHGGATWADGAVGEGATFRFSLPSPLQR